MTGKVFSDSANIYQDEAQVLFNYYKMAAEKIVSQETENERIRDELKKQITSADAEGRKQDKQKKILFVAGTVCAVAGILIFIISKNPAALIVSVAGLVMFYLAYKANQAVKNAEDTIKDCTEKYKKKEEEYKNIRRDYSIDKLGVVYVPVATRVPFNGKSFLIDHTDSVGDVDFRLTLLNQPEEFKSSVESLQKSLESMPIVDSNDSPENINTSDYSLSMQNMTLHDYSGNIDRQVRNISYLLNDSQDVSVDIPVVEPRSEEAAFIREHATSDTGGKHIVNVFNTEFQDKLSKFTELHASRNQFSTEGNNENTEYLKQLMVRLAESVQLMSKTKNAGASNLVNYTNSILGTVLKAGYNYYSPLLEADEIERIRSSEFDYKTSVDSYEPFKLKQSSRVKYDLFTGNWVADDGSKTAMPFGMHQVDEEVLMPVISSLMEENRIERLRIYSDIENQKRDYLERWSAETNNYFRDNRQAADELINRMRETFADYSNAYNMYLSLQKTVDMMKSSSSIEDTEVVEQDSEAEMIAGFEQQAKLFNEQQEEFSGYMDRIMDDINDTTRGFSHIEYYEGSLRDSLSHDTAVAMSEIGSLNDRKRQLLGISPYLAKNAELPPAPKTTEEMRTDAAIDLQQQVRESLEMIEKRESAADISGQETEEEFEKQSMEAEDSAWCENKLDSEEESSDGNI